MHSIYIKVIFWKRNALISFKSSEFEGSKMAAWVVLFVSPPSSLQLFGHLSLDKGYPDSISGRLRDPRDYTSEGGRTFLREDVEIGENSPTQRAA